MFRREVGPARSGWRWIADAIATELLPVILAAAVGAAVGLSIAHALTAPPRPVVLERVRTIEVPSLCESRDGVWQRCWFVKGRR